MSMLASNRGLWVAREHACELCDTLLAQDWCNGRDRSVSLLDLVDDKMVVGIARYLRKMRDDHNLVSLGERLERPTHGKCCLAADTSVDLIKDKRRWSTRQDQSQRQHRPSKLASRRHPREALQRLTLVGRKEKLEIIAEAHGRERDLDAGARESKFVEMIGDLLAK